MNHKANGAYARRAPDGGKLAMPVLFLHGAYDVTCETMTSRLAEPMRRDCAQLTEVVVHSGHWMAQEQPVAVNAALATWLATKLPAYWQGKACVSFPSYSRCCWHCLPLPRRRPPAPARLQRLRRSRRNRQPRTPPCRP
jgi:hypothetical protein